MFLQYKTDVRPTNLLYLGAFSSLRSLVLAVLLHFPESSHILKKKKKEQKHIFLWPKGIWLLVFIFFGLENNEWETYISCV